MEKLQLQNQEMKRLRTKLEDANSEIMMRELLIDYEKLKVA